DFSDQCCSPSYITERPDWGTCHLHFSTKVLHTNNHCFILIVTGVCGPHVNTIDNATINVQNHPNSNASNIDLIYPDDLFQIHVHSLFLPPALSYMKRTHGYGSIFSNYTIIAVNFTFVISNNGKFGNEH
ncbi:unnamed protein product, partial [Rotaria sp. Silwood1]